MNIYDEAVLDWCRETIKWQGREAELNERLAEVHAEHGGKQP